MNIVVAVDECWGIGYEGTQTVVVPEDRKHFKEVTGSGTLIYGSRTLKDFPGKKPLKNRRNIVLTRNPKLKAPGAELAGSIEEVLALVKDEDEDNVFVIGGASVYEQLLPYCKKAFVTKLDAIPPDDVYFPNLDESHDWHLEDRGEEREYLGMRYRFLTYVNDNIKK